MTRDEFEASAAEAGIEVKGKKMPYCSANGHMFALLDAEGQLCLRYGEDRRAELAQRWGVGPVLQYGAVMKGYVAVPDSEVTAPRIAEARDYVMTLKPK